MHYHHWLGLIDQKGQAGVTELGRAITLGVQLFYAALQQLST